MLFQTNIGLPLDAFPPADGEVARLFTMVDKVIGDGLVDRIRWDRWNQENRRKSGL
jgi:hypothetical protein